MRDKKDLRHATEKELKDVLGDAAYHVVRESGTDMPYQHPYDKLFDVGIYVDIITKEVLFLSKDKFDAGCGWPSWTGEMSTILVLLSLFIYLKLAKSCQHQKSTCLNDWCFIFNY